MNRKVLSGVLIFSIALNLAVIGTFLYHRFRGPGYPPPEFGKEVQGRFFRNLDIPLPKKEKLFTLMKSFRDESRPLQERIYSNEKHLIEQIENEESSREEINTTLDTLAALRLRQSQKAINHFLKARAFLSPPQQRRLFEMILRMRPPMGRGMRNQRSPRQRHK